MGGDHTFFGNLPAADRAALLATTHERTLAAGEQLFRHGEAGSSFAVILSGRFKLVTRAATGRTVFLCIRGPGELIGEMAVLDENPRTADVLAVETARVAVGGAAALRQLLAQRPTAALALAKSLSWRLRESDEARVEMAALTGAARVAVRLIELSEQHGRSTPAGVEIDLALTQDEIADWTGLSRPAVARALADLRAARLVVTGRRSLTLPDPERLRALAD
jgi:CRP/FNR family transcriptional regulator, cyclic AMP receptor protein